MATARSRIPIEEIMKPIEAICARCGGSCVILPQKNGPGICICPVCSTKPKRKLRMKKLKRIEE